MWLFRLGFSISLVNRESTSSFWTVFVSCVIRGCPSSYEYDVLEFKVIKFDVLCFF